MKKLLLFVCAILFYWPDGVTAQVFTAENLTIHAGAEYPSLQVSPDRYSNREAFHIQPHFQLSYPIMGREKFDISIYAGYSKLGGKVVNTINEDDIFSDTYKTKSIFSIPAIALGFKGIWKFDSFGVGPVISGNRLFNPQYTTYTNEGGGWSSTRALYTSFYQGAMVDYLVSAGLTFQYKTGSSFIMGLEGLYGLQDIINQQKARVMPQSRYFGSVNWHPRSFRIMVGYSF